MYMCTWLLYGGEPPYPLLYNVEISLVIYLLTILGLLFHIYTMHNNVCLNGIMKELNDILLFAHQNLTKQQQDN